MNRDMKASEMRVLKDQMLKALPAPEPIDASALLEGARRRAREGPVPHDAICLDCGYALRGLCCLAGESIYRRRCPECGRRFEPDDPSTFGRRRAPPPSSWLLVVLTVGALAVALLPFLLQALR